MSFVRKLRTTIAADSTVDLDMGPLSRMPVAGRLQMWAAQNTVANTAVSVTVLLGTDIISDGARVNINDATRVDSVAQDRDLVADGRGRLNDPITIRAANVGAGAAILNSLIAVS